MMLTSIIRLLSCLTHVLNITRFMFINKKRVLQKWWPTIQTHKSLLALGLLGCLAEDMSLNEEEKTNLTEPEPLYVYQQPPPGNVEPSPWPLTLWCLSLRKVAAAVLSVRPLIWLASCVCIIMWDVRKLTEPVLLILSGRGVWNERTLYLIWNITLQSSETETISDYIQHLGK